MVITSKGILNFCAKGPKRVLEGVRTHLEKFKYEIGLTLEFLKEKEFVIPLDTFVIETDIPKGEILNKNLTFNIKDKVNLTAKGTGVILLIIGFNPP